MNAATPPAQGAGAVPIHVLFALLPDSLALDWAGPAEALRIANQLCAAQGRAAPFALHFVGPAPQLQSSVGLALAGVEPLPGVLPEPCWLVLVGLAGQRVDVQRPHTQALLHWLRGLRLQRQRLELVTVCAGTLLAAHAGLLAGRRATTHHHHLQQLAAAEPRCDVVANRVFVADGPLYSSAGVTTGIDLLLHRVAEVCGPALAAQVAQALVMPLRRGPHDPQQSPFLQYREHLHAGVHRVQDAVAQQPAQDWNLAAMARLAHVSPRHLARLFDEHAGIAPLQYLRRIRLAAAEAALQSGASVTQAAAVAGFSSDTQLRRAWHRFGCARTPSQVD